MKKLRVLVIDDSAYNRQTISEILDSHGEIEVVGKAFDGEEGLKLAAQLKPDLITLDIEMPRMDGFTFLRILMSRMPTPVIVISSHTRKDEVFQALELGALDFVAKPSHHIGPEIKALREELFAKILTVRQLERLSFVDGQARRLSGPAVPQGDAKDVGSASREVKRVVCLGASTGGPPALEALFKALPRVDAAAFLVVQHMPEKFTRAFAERLDRMVSLQIREAEQGMPLLGGAAYVAPGGAHMEVAHAEGSGPLIRLHAPREADRYVPSVDRTFVSAAREFGKATLAVVLTGMGSDGAEGTRAVRKAGGRTLAEGQESAIVFGMPKEAINTGCVDEVLPLQGIIERVHGFAGGKGGES